MSETRQLLSSVDEHCNWVIVSQLRNSTSVSLPEIDEALAAYTQLIKSGNESQTKLPLREELVRCFDKWIASSVMLPELVDVRLVYLVYSVLFLINAFTSDQAEPIPFYIFTQGDLAKLIWQHPNFLQIHVGSACLNFAFMMGVGILAIVLVAVKRHFWRAE